MEKKENSPASSASGTHVGEILVAEGRPEKSQPHPNTLMMQLIRELKLSCFTDGYVEEFFDKAKGSHSAARGIEIPLRRFVNVHREWWWNMGGGLATGACIAVAFCLIFGIIASMLVVTGHSRGNWVWYASGVCLLCLVAAIIGTVACQYIGRLNDLVIIEKKRKLLPATNSNENSTRTQILVNEAHEKARKASLRGFTVHVEYLTEEIKGTKSEGMLIFSCEGADRIYPVKEVSYWPGN